MIVRGLPESENFRESGNSREDGNIRRRFQRMECVDVAGSHAVRGPEDSVAEAIEPVDIRVGDPRPAVVSRGVRQFHHSKRQFHQPHPPQQFHASADDASTHLIQVCEERFHVCCIRRLANLISASIIFNGRSSSSRSCCPVLLRQQLASVLLLGIFAIFATPVYNASVAPVGQSCDN